MKNQQVFMVDQVRDRVATIMAVDPRHPGRRRAQPVSMVVFAALALVYGMGLLPGG